MIYSAKKYKHVAIGGTFDRLHIGHEALLHQAFRISSEISLGLTTTAMTKHKFLSETILPYQERKAELTSWINKHYPHTNWSIHELHDSYGLTLKDKTIKAIVVTEETIETAREINQLRLKNDLNRIEILSVGMKHSRTGNVIRSELIRKGVMNRHGFENSSLFRSSLSLPDLLRPELKIPFGKIYTSSAQIGNVLSKQPLMVVAVGDVVSRIDFGNIPSLKIVDFRTKRKQLKPITHEDASNPAGTIMHEAVCVIEKALNNYFQDKKIFNAATTLIIDGEEDLLALPAILLSPLSSLVLYGLRDKGFVVVEVTEETKEKVRSIVEKFEKIPVL